MLRTGVIVPPRNRAESIAQALRVSARNRTASAHFFDPHRMTPPDLYAWRKAERRRLLAAREAVPAEKLDEWRRVMDMHLQRSFPELVHGVVAFCWPYRGEYDPR